MDLFAEIADERRRAADLLADLTDEQLATQSLCSAWSVHEVAAHLVTPLEVGIPRFALAMLASRGDFDRANLRLTSRQARRPVGELVAVLRHEAESRFTPPGAGPEAPLTDLLVHGLDIRWPLGLTREVPERRARTSLTFLTSRSARGLVPRGAVDGLTFTADDLDWTHGTGPLVTGTADALLLALTGRTTALEHLSGDGLPTLQVRLHDAARQRSDHEARGHQPRRRELSPMVLDTALVEGVRAALAGRPSVREVTMFGGLAFMVDDRMVVCVRRDGDLLVRAAPERADELLALEGAGPAEMGAGRPMGRSWISVGRQALSSDEQLGSWIDVALEHHGRGGAPARARTRSG